MQDSHNTMFAKPPYQFVTALLGIFLLAACGEKKSTSNKVTVTPAARSRIQSAMAAGFDKSPMDMVYFPPDYPKMKMAKSDLELPIARAIYSRPQKGGRTVFGQVLKYGERWRLGANEATEIEFFKNVSIQGRKVAHGRYILYAIPYEDKWTVILNTDLYTWGLKIDSTKDVHQFSIPIQKTNLPFEAFTLDFEETGKSMALVMEWDSVRAILPIQY